MRILVQVPGIFAIDTRWSKNSIRQLIHPSEPLDVLVERYQEGRAKGYILTSLDELKIRILVLSNQSRPPGGFDRVLRIKPEIFEGNEGKIIDLSASKWTRHPQLLKHQTGPINYAEQQENIIDSWQSAFSYVCEDSVKGIKGLRLPQMGAIHATHAHWAVTDETATIVMPTGTGKTETMLCVLISQQCEKLLVVVPTDALRSQIADKFLTLGVLKANRIISNQVLYPIVGVLKHKPKSREEVDEFFRRCNVIVATINTAGQCDTQVQECMADHCPFLFIDEAHHIAAVTWKSLKRSFARRRVLQFTATPFRNDDQPVDGRIIFNYPLKKAQEQGYFKPIHFKPIGEFDSRKVDEAIAEAAIEQLREDLGRQYNHIVMARVDSIARAEQVFLIYDQYGEFNPVQLHTGIKSQKERERIREKIISGESKIVICVDMLGEGFDLPELKIAAFHDIRKSFAVTLQLAGRFTRATQDLGDATFIANIADIDVQQELRKLYSQDADWNVLLAETSKEIIESRMELREFIDGFQDTLTDIQLWDLRPALSTVIYKTKCINWDPENFQKGIRGAKSLDRIEHIVNAQENTLIVVTGKKIAMNWTRAKEVFNWDWELFVLFWEQDQNLLFIHGSSNRGNYEKLAGAVAGKVEIINGAHVFRCISGITRLKLQNVGLREQLGRLIRFIMRAGSDVEPAMTQAQKQQAVKLVVFGSGYECAGRATIGCSYKGRIWSQRRADIDTLRKWCCAVGRKVLDETINADRVLEGTLVPISITQRPPKMPVSIDWPDVIYQKSEIIYTLVVDETELPLFQTDIQLLNPTENEDLKFEICSGNLSAQFNLTFFDSDYGFHIVENTSASLKHGEEPRPLEDFFSQHPPIIWFADGSSLEGNSYTELKRKFDPYPRKKIQTCDWRGVDITKESQGIVKKTDSIQYRIVEALKRKKYNVIFDDDGPGETADVVCISVGEKSMMVEFYHCKFSKETRPGARIDDLYDVCGQAQKSVRWRENPTKLFDRLLRREATREKENGTSRFEIGNQDELFKIKEMSRTVAVNLRIFIVQPGLSKSEASKDQLELLSVTENHLMETYKLPFGIIASD